MANTNKYVKVLEKREVFLAETGAPIYLGDFKTVNAQIRVLSAGSAGTICLQHAARPEDSAFKTLGDTVSLAGPANDFQAHTNFLCWVRFMADENVADHPIACIDIVAKES